jgi:hypothetical protein
MRLMTSVVWLALCGAVIGLTACGDSGGGSDAGPDGSTDTDSDTDTDTDADGGTDTDLAPAVSCPVFVNGSLGDYGGHDGSSWAVAYPTVQVGLDGASFLIDMDGGVAECEVWVAAGTYVPTTDTDRSATFSLLEHVALYGGFAGTETLLSERNIAANETILSGDLGIVGDNSDNAYHVVGGADDATIDGFTITGGNADGVYSSAGGGMFNYEVASPTVTNCTFSGNSARSGGGMFNRQSSPIMTNCTFTGNSAEEDGGGVYNMLGSSPTVTNCTFSGNSAGGWGGGMHNRIACDSIITNCTFSGNTADSGGGMYSADSEPAVTNCILWGDTDGAGVSEIYDDEYSSVVATYSAIQGGFTGEGNIDADPLFVSLTDLHLQSTSPCIDTGSNDAVPTGVTTDIDGNPRIVDGNADSTATVDMGAYEYQL